MRCTFQILLLILLGKLTLSPQILSIVFVAKLDFKIDLAYHFDEDGCLSMISSSLDRLAILYYVILN